MIHELYFKANLIKPGQAHSTLRFHSLRKYFKTNLIAAGVPESYADFWMGHLRDTFNTIESKGVESHRNLLAKSRTQPSPQDPADRLRHVSNSIETVGQGSRSGPGRGQLLRSSQDSHRRKEHQTGLRKNNPLKSQRTSEFLDSKICLLEVVRPPGFEPGFPALSVQKWEAGVIDQAARQPSQ